MIIKSTLYFLTRICIVIFALFFILANSAKASSAEVLQLLDDSRKLVQIHPVDLVIALELFSQIAARRERQRNLQVHLRA